MTALAVPDYDRGPACVWLSWEHYLAWLAGKLRTTHDADGRMVRLGSPWAPGEHLALIGPTGEGKTTHAIGILGLRKYVLALDPKGEDETLSASGYLRVGSIWKNDLRWRIKHRDDARTWDHIWRAIEDRRPARIIVGGPADDDAQFTRLKELINEATNWCRYIGGWTMYCDEFEVASSRDMFNLAPAVNLSLITARRKKVSVVNSYQAQAWVSKHAIRQARKAIMWSTGDRDMIQAVARGMGRSWQETAELIDQLPPYWTSTIPRGKNGGPMVITHAPKVY
jgi:hypothetical protein